MRKRGGRMETRLGVALALGLALAAGGCGLDKVEVPDYDGPSVLGLDVKLGANPDIVVADGFATSLVQATVRDQNGRLVSGRALFFSVNDAEGRIADIGSLRSTSGTGVGTGIQASTNSSGVAQVVYEAPVRTDATAHQSVLIAVRPVGDDFNGQVYRTVRIELRSAEPRLFPQVPGNRAPACNFVVEPAVGPYRVNTVIGFQSTSADTDGGTIVRYQWYFGDGTSGDDKPDVAHVYRFAGTFSATHVVTDNGGAFAACEARMVVVP